MRIPGKADKIYILLAFLLLNFSALGQISGIFTIDKSLIKIDWDDFEMEMIDGGAEEIDSDAEEGMITTAFEDFGSMSHKLDELGIEAKSAELQRIANNTKDVNEEQFKANMKMLDRFEEDDDVQNVYHNMEITF